MNSLMRRKGMQTVVTHADVEHCDHDQTDQSVDSEHQMGSADHLESVPKGGKVKLFHCYKSILEVDDIMWKSKEAMSAIVFGGRLGIACIVLGNPRFVPLIKGNLEGYKMCFHYYFLSRVEREDGGLMYEVLVETDIQEHAILLPRYQLMNSNDPRFVRGTYAVVDKIHRKLDGTGGLVY